MAKMPFVEDDDVIKAISADGSDQLSASPFCQGDRADIGRSRMPYSQKNETTGRTVRVIAPAQVYGSHLVT